MARLLLLALSLGAAVDCGSGGGGGGGFVSPPPASTAIYVAISPSGSTSIDAGQTVKFTATVEDDSTNAGVTWSASAPNLTGSACGTFTSITSTSAVYNAPATVASNSSVTIMATSVADASKSSSGVVSVSPSPTITTTTLGIATPNANYSTTLAASGGTGTLTWSMVSGALPTGLALSSSGAVTGDSTVSGTFNFTVEVTDSSSAAAGPVSVEAPLSLIVVTPVSISTTPLPAGSEGIAYVAGIQAAGGTPPYAWSVTNGALPSGLTLEAASGVISGIPTSQGDFSFKVSAEDSSPTRQTQISSLTLAIGVPGPLAITTTALLDGPVATAYTARVAATGGTPPYTWSVESGALPAGLTLNGSTGAISGTPSTVETASFTLEVADSSSPHQTESQQLTLAVVSPPMPCPSSGNNGVLNGAYAFSLSGFNSLGFVAVVGSFTADGTGKITAGEADANGALGAQTGSINTSASAYSVGTDNRGCATLATPFGTFVTRFTLGSVSSGVAGGGSLIEWDSPSSSAYIASGQLLRQSSTAFAAGLAGSYVFRTLGWDPSTTGGRDACLGAITAAGNTFTTLEQDCNDAWNLTNVYNSPVAGTYSALDASGRGTAILALGAINSTVVFYAVSGSKLLTVNADAGPFLGGEWDQQTLPSGGNGFAQSSLKGNMVFSLSGVSLNGTATAVSVETATADGSSTLALTFYEDRAGTLQVSSTFTCGYDVEPNGRVTLSSSTQACGGTLPVLYLASANTGFIVDAAPGVDVGSFEPQSAGPFTNDSVSGNFYGGMAELAAQFAQAEVEPVEPSGSGSFTGTTVTTSMTAQDPGCAFAASSYAVNSDGTFSMDASSGAIAGVIISSTKFLMFSPSTMNTNQPGLLVLQK